MHHQHGHQLGGLLGFSMWQSTQFAESPHPWQRALMPIGGMSTQAWGKGMRLPRQSRTPALGEEAVRPTDSLLRLGHAVTAVIMMIGGDDRGRGHVHIRVCVHRPPTLEGSLRHWPPAMLAVGQHYLARNLAWFKMVAPRIAGWWHRPRQGSMTVGHQDHSRFGNHVMHRIVLKANYWSCQLKVLQEKGKDFAPCSKKINLFHTYKESLWKIFEGQYGEVDQLLIQATQFFHAPTIGSLWSHIPCTFKINTTIF